MAHIRSDSPVFPAWAHDHRWSWVLEEDALLRRTTRAYFEAGHWSHFWLLDSQLRSFSPIEVVPTGRAGLFGWRPGFAGTYLNISIRFATESLTLADAKRSVAQFLHANPQVCESSGDSVTRRLRAVEQAASAAALIQALR